MYDLAQEILNKTRWLWDEPVFTDSDSGEDISSPDEQKAYERGLLCMREAIIGICRLREREIVRQICGVTATLEYDEPRLNTQAKKALRQLRSIHRRVMPKITC